MTCNGMLAGLVAITAPCAFVAPWASVVIGIIAGFLVCYSVELLRQEGFEVDDPCGAISVHGMCGLWGVLAVGLFADGTYGIGWNGSLAALHGAGASSTATGASSAPRSSTWSSASSGRGESCGCSSVLAMTFMKTRVSPEVEIAGLDEAEFGQFCYPDFVIRAETDLGVTHELDVPAGSSAGEGNEPVGAS